MNLNIGRSLNDVVNQFLVLVAGTFQSEGAEIVHAQKDKSALAANAGNCIPYLDLLSLVHGVDIAACDRFHGVERRVASDCQKLNAMHIRFLFRAVIAKSQHN